MAGGRKRRPNLALVSPAGIAMPAAGLCFACVTFFFKCRLSLSFLTTGGLIATQIVALTLSIKKPTATNLVNFGPVTHEILWLICVGGDCREANIRTVLVNGHSPGGSSIASL